MPERQAEKRDAAALTLTFEAWRWAGIHCWSSPEPMPNNVTKDEGNN